MYFTEAKKEEEVYQTLGLMTVMNKKNKNLKKRSK